MLKINPYVHVFKKNRITALYNILNLSTVYLNNEEFKGILTNPPKVYLEEQFVVDQNFDADKYFKSYVESIKDNNDIGLAYFLVTSDCNFNCKYCFIESRIKTRVNKVMSKEIASKGIDLILKNIRKKNFKIIFYGGEPLLNFKTVKFVVEKVKESKKDIQFSIITNGSLINDEIIEFIKANKISLSISLDSVKGKNDKARVDKNNKGTYDNVIENMRILKKSGVKFGISCTLSTYNYKTPQEIIKIMDEFQIRSMGFNLLSINENIKINRKERISMVKNILKTEDIIFKKKLIEDKIINRKLKSFIEKKNWTRDCAGYGKQIVITPDGLAGVCHGLWPDMLNDDVKNYFDIDVNYNEDIKDHPSWKEWFRRTPFNMPQCRSCFAIGLCGGGCAKNSLIRKGSIWEIDEDICILAKKTVPWVIWKYYDLKMNEILINY